MLTALGKEVALGDVPVRERTELIRRINDAFSMSSRIQPSAVDSAVTDVKA